MHSNTTSSQPALTRRRFLSLTGAALGSALLAGCSVARAAGRAPQQGDEGLTVHIGDQPSFYLLKVADKKGFFKDEFAHDGITVKVSQFVNVGPAIVEALKSQDLDLGALGALPLITATAGGAPFTSLASINYVEDQFKLVAGKESGVHGVKDLAGKRVGVKFATNSHQMVLELLKKYGVARSDVELVNISDDDIISSLSANKIAAGSVGNTALASAQAVGAYPIADNSETGLITNSLVGREAFIKDHPRVVVRVLKVLKRADAWIAAHPDETAEIFAEAAKSDLAAAKKNLQARKVKLSIGSRYLTEPLQHSIEFAREAKLISRDIRVQDIVDTSFAQKAGVK